jgi:GT2 family glycosyltransferase
MLTSSDIADVNISIVIVTYNRADELCRLLDSISADLARDDVEMILVDDGSTDDTFERTAPVLERLGNRGRLVQQPNSGPGTGRNRGITLARGSIIVFVDTDCIAPPGWLDALVEPLSDPEIGATGGPDRSHPDDPIFARFVDYLMTAMLTTGGVRGSEKTRGGSYCPRSFNMAIRRDTARDVDGFPVIWYGEDILLSWRIREAGFRLEFAPKAWLYHLRRTSIRGWARQLYRMGRARWWMGRYNSDLMEPVYLVPIVEWLIGMSALVGIANGGWSAMAGTAVVALAGLYLSAIGIDATRKLSHPGALIAVPALFLMREAAYALGSLTGLVTRIPNLEGVLSQMTADDAPE